MVVWNVDPEMMEEGKREAAAASGGILGAFWERACVNDSIEQCHTQVLHPPH